MINSIFDELLVVYATELPKVLPKWDGFKIKGGNPDIRHLAASNATSDDPART
ncbi:MAG: hypothetical protein O3C43_21885 [Verrucomicrobia bacterium]|nr:hypothetical protein [Verrucomicrobiota bacterium]MDA1069146.1 hypothetical protein [Verrucomicrobiota bacterium]